MVPGEVRRGSEPKVEQQRLVSNDRVRANVKMLKEGMGECLVIRRRCVRHGETHKQTDLHFKPYALILQNNG